MSFNTDRTSAAQDYHLILPTPPPQSPDDVYLRFNILA